jgi:hypothetical protein
MLNDFDKNMEKILSSNSRPCGNLLSGRCDTNNGRDAPAFMACLKRRPHNINLKEKETGLSNEKSVASCLVVGGATYVARRVKREVESTICELDEVVLNTFVLG